MTNKITALYARNAQANPDRIRRQISNLTVMAERERFQNLQCFTDDGVSGTTADRPGLNALMEAIRSNKVAAVLVTDGTRLARNYQLFGKLVQEMNDNGVRVILGMEKQQYLPEHIHDDSNGLDYTLHGDYYFPDIKAETFTLSELGIGKFGLKYYDYLRDHKKNLFMELLKENKLAAHLKEIDQAANDRMERARKDFYKQFGVTEELKAQDQMAWIHRAGMAESIAEEFVLNDLIYT